MTKKAKPSSSEVASAKAARKVFIVEDHPVFREGLVQIINGEDDLTMCGEAEDCLLYTSPSPRDS